MTSTLYIPSTIVVGFQKRTDTFTGKLAYVIYKDHTGKLRKETSWNGWRDKTIDIVEVPNVATPNFTLNKGVQRSREWFGSGRSMVRVWDPRDFEFEITVDNLLNVLMHADVSKRDITEPCVYAWQGSNLVLLPTNSVEYQESLKHTEKQGVKTSAKSLVVGYTYAIKRDSTTRVVYLGRFDRFEYNKEYGTGVATCVQKPKKYHVFIDENTKEVFARDPSAFVAGVISDELHPQLASLMDTYYSSIESQPVVGLVIDKTPDQYGGHGLWFQIGDEFVEFEIDESVKNNRLAKDDREYYISVRPTEFARFDTTGPRILFSYDEYGRTFSYSYHQNRRTINPTSLTAFTPAVQMLCSQIETIAAQYSYNNYRDGHNWEKQRAMHTMRNQVLTEQLGAGRLACKLADGKIAFDRHF